MALWGQYRYGEKKWGWDGVPALTALRRNVLSANHPWVRRLGIVNGYRAADFALWTVNPTTLADVTQLPHIAGGTRESGWEDIPVQTEKLSVTVMDPDEYRVGGAYHSLQTLGTLLRLYWNVRSVYGAVQLGTGLYRVTREIQPAREDADGSDGGAIEAEGWLELPLRTLMLDGANPIGDAVTLRDNLLALGLPIVWNLDTYATLVAAVVYQASGHRLRVPEAWPTVNWWGHSGPTPTEPPPPPAPIPPATPPAPPDATVGIGPNTTNAGELTHFEISWVLTDAAPSGDDRIYLAPDDESQAAASVTAASLPSDDPHLVPTMPALAGTTQTDVALNFADHSNAGCNAWYWHRAYGCIGTPGHVALLY